MPSPMDETPEELDQIRREAAKIDPYKYRKRLRALAALGLGAVGAGAVWLVLEMFDKSRNPCERLRDHLCRGNATTLSCRTYGDVARESNEEPSAKMRSDLRAQCVRKIERIKEEEGAVVR